MYLLQHKASTFNDLVPAIYLLMDCSWEGHIFMQIQLCSLTSYLYGYICCSKSPVCFSFWSTVFCSFLRPLFMQCCFTLLPSNSFSISFSYPSLLPQFLFSLSSFNFSQFAFCLSSWFAVVLPPYPHLVFDFPSLISFVFCTIPIVASLLFKCSQPSLVHFHFLLMQLL